MKARGFDPQRLDVAALARAGATIEARWPLAQLDRLAASAHPDVPVRAEVTASARGERVERVSAPPRHLLHLQAETSLPLVCQRCLAPVPCELSLRRPIVFVEGEDHAAALDAEIDDDVLALAPAMDLRELIEDELLLALPLVPRHDRCPDPLPVAAPAGDDGERRHPFADLRALRDRAGEGGSQGS